MYTKHTMEDLHKMNTYIEEIEMIRMMVGRHFLVASYALVGMVN